MLSNPKVQAKLAAFVTVKIDPRAPGVSRAPFRHKSTRYVPELVVIDARNGGETVLAKLKNTSVSGVTKALQQASETFKR